MPRKLRPKIQIVWSSSLFSFLLLCASIAYADYSIPYGWYIEVNAGDAKNSGASYSGNSSTGSGIGINANLGYKFMPYFAAEIGYTQYKDTTLKDQYGVQAATIKHAAFDFAGKGIIPFQQAGLEIFGKLGIQRGQGHVSISNSTAAANLGITGSTNNTTGLYYGIGGQYYFMPNFAFVVQWARAEGSGSTGTQDLYSIGLSFIFE